MYFPKLTVFASSLGRFQTDYASLKVIPKDDEAAGN
jgi:hypothetical protein